MSKNARGRLNAIYRDPLPVSNIIHLPPIDFYNPLSILVCFYAYLFPKRPTRKRLNAVLSEYTLSATVHDEADAQRLWCSGFFGKGTFSRSEPSWFIRTQRALGIIGEDESLTAEEVTARRRVARAKMKAERARAEKEELERTLRDEGKLPPSVIASEELQAVEQEITELEGQVPSQGSITDQRLDEETPDGAETGIPNLETMQLTLHETLFLSVALDALDVYAPSEQGVKTLIPKAKVLHTILSLFPDTTSEQASTMTTGGPTPRQSFMIGYAVYHHYRSLGWTVKSGIKFGVDWLLYKRGPVFSHAEFSIVVVPTPIIATSNPSPSLSATSSLDPSARQAGVDTAVHRRPWWWVHTLTRVNGQVKKTVILAYVTYDPARTEFRGPLEDEIRRGFFVRECSLRRWIPSRNRD